MANRRKDWFVMGSLAGATASIIKTLINFGDFGSVPIFFTKDHLRFSIQI
ncbi:hypothetical protein [Desulfosporosinus fructosivorans]